MVEAEIYIKEQKDEFGINKPYNEYENQFEIIDNKEDFLKYIGRKFKLAWINERDKLCLKSFIFVGQDNENKEQFVAVKVIKGISQPKTKEDIHKYSEFFMKEKLVFVGFVEKDEIFDTLKLKIQGM
jgi:hypothetical protein